MNELIVSKNNKLVSKEEWDRQIDQLKEKIDETISDEKKAAEEIKIRIVDAVKESLPEEKFALLFSGGIDSTIIAFIAKKLGRNFTCYSFGLKGADDLEWARKASKELGLELTAIEMSKEDFERCIINTSKILGECDAVKISVGTVFYPLLEQIKKDKINHVVSGLGSEEIFAGYERHSEAEDINDECWKGLYTIFERDFTRDTKLAQHFGIELHLPFLDKSLVESAMKIDGKLKIKDRHKKYILRIAAEMLGLSEEFCWRKKKAAQYGSKANKAFMQIANKRGFRTRKEFAESILNIERKTK